MNEIKEIGMRASSLELAIWHMERAASNGQPLHAPASLARQFLALDRLESIVKDDDLRDELGNHTDSRLRLLGEISSRNAGDIAAKLAAVVIASEEMEAPDDMRVFRILARALAELVILGDAPLPDTSAIEAMTGEDTELQVMPPSALRERQEAGE